MPVTVIEAGRKAGFDLREIATQRELLYYLVRRDVLVRYVQTVLGLGWAVAWDKPDFIGRDAMVAQRDFEPHLIVSDIAMPEEDGYSLMSRIRSLPPESGGKLPSIALSAFTTEESKKKAFDSGFQLYSSKPFDPDGLISQIRQLLVDTGQGQREE